MGLRLLHAIASMDPVSGGPVEGVRQLTAINTIYGHTVEIVTLDSPDSPWVKQSPVPVHATGPALGAYGWSFKYFRWIKENAANYDAVIINGIWNFNALGAWLALRKQDVPYMVFTHGMLDPWFKHRYPLKHAKKWLYWPWGLYPLLRDANAVFFTCQRECDLARESFWLYDCNEVIVRYGTAGVPDFDRDYRQDFFAKHPALQGKRFFLFFGRVHPKKGPDLLIEAVGRMKRSGQWDVENMRLVLAGPTDSEYAERLKKLIVTEDIADVTYWTGMLTGDEKWGVLQAAEAFVLPSHQENFGIAVAESLSVSVPVLITHAVNISPEIAVDGAGFSEEDTVSGVYRMLRKWILLPEPQREEMRRQARRTFLNRYTADVGAKDMLRSIYLTLATRKIAAQNASASPVSSMAGGGV
jgi:glycosyltransferase involved in cell wall biosynthesis